MPKKNREYWQERYEQLEKSAHLYSLSTYAQIEPAFTQAQMEIQKDIDAWYGRIAVNNNVTLQEAKKLLTADELAEFKWDVNEYIKYGKENAINHQWVKQLENASSKYHINKLEALKIRTQQAVEKAFGNELDAVDSMARKVYSNSYYHSIFEMQKGFNMGREIATINEKALEKIITKPWAADGKNFSDRIWQSKAQLVNELHNQLTRTVLLGNKPDSAIKAISDKFNVSKSQAANLVMTEQTYFHSLATYDSFKSMGIKQYEFLATLDKRTTQMCRSMDGKHFPMSEYMPGATAPPLHPRCRSVTVPYFDDEYSDLFNNGSMRAARNEDDKTYYVPADMNYREWEKQFVVQKSKGKSSGKGNDLNKTKLPKLIKIIDFNDKIAIMKEIEDFEKKAVELPYETNCTVTADGKVWNIDGSDGFVDAELIQTQNNGSNLNGSYAYHNHTKENTHFSFSGEDVGFFLELGETFSKASDYKYSYVMKRTADTLSAKYSDIVSEFTKIYQSTIYEKSFENLIDIDEDGFHEVLKILSKKYNFKYKREKNDK